MQWLVLLVMCTWVGFEPVTNMRIQASLHLSCSDSLCIILRQARAFFQIKLTTWMFQSSGFEQQNSHKIFMFSGFPSSHFCAHFCWPVISQCCLVRNHVPLQMTGRSFAQSHHETLPLQLPIIIGGFIPVIAGHIPLFHGWPQRLLSQWEKHMKSPRLLGESPMSPMCWHQAKITCIGHKFQRCQRQWKGDEIRMVMIYTGDGYYKV